MALMQEGKMALMQEGKHHLTRSSTFHFHFVYSVLYLKLVGSPRKMVIVFTRSIDMIFLFFFTE